jgi:hypothetical protein
VIKIGATRRAGLGSRLETQLGDEGQGARMPFSPVPFSANESLQAKSKSRRNPIAVLQTASWMSGGIVIDVSFLLPRKPGWPPE